MAAHLNILQYSYITIEGSAAGVEVNDLVVPEGLDYAGMEYAYDENENWISRRYFDAEEKSVICSETGYAVYERRYNNIKQLVAGIYYDENGNYINSVNGYAMIEYIYMMHPAIPRTGSTITRLRLGNGWRVCELESAAMFWRYPGKIKSQG